jgi:hypothetical protein
MIELEIAGQVGLRQFSGLHAITVARHPSMSVKDATDDHNYGLPTWGSQCAIWGVNGLQH